MLRINGLVTRQKSNSAKVKVWSARKQAVFFKLLADLLKSGFSLQQALESIVVLQPEQAVEIKHILTMLSNGNQISQAMKDVVSKNTFYQLVIAERHGQLDDSVHQLGEILERRVRQQEKIRMLLLYPAILFILLASIITGAQIWLKPALNQFGIMNSYSKEFSYINLVYYCIWILLSAAVVYCLKILYWWKKQSILSKHHWYSQLPIIGSVYRQYCYYYVSLNLGLLLSSGLDFHQICQYLLNFEHNSLLYQMGRQLTSWLEKGEEIKDFVKLYPFIPTEMGIFFSKGQTQEKLSSEMLVYSRLAYQKLMRKFDQLIGLVQPLLFLVIAIIIVGTYLTILLPLYKNMGGLYK